MTTIHLTDAQRETFAACGLIVIDGEPCRDGCDPDCVGGRRIVTLTATCDRPWCTYTQNGHTCLACGHFPNPGAVTLGRFTIPALLPVVDAHHMAPDVDPGGIVIEVADGSLWMMPKDQPLPHPGQFIARPERVA